MDKNFLAAFPTKSSKGKSRTLHQSYPAFARSGTRERVRVAQFSRFHATCIPATKTTYRAKISLTSPKKYPMISKKKYLYPAKQKICEAIDLSDPASPTLVQKDDTPLFLVAGK